MQICSRALGSSKRIVLLSGVHCIRAVDSLILVICTGACSMMTEWTRTRAPFKARSRRTRRSSSASYPITEKIATTPSRKYAALIIPVRKKEKTEGIDLMKPDSMSFRQHIFSSDLDETWYVGKGRWVMHDDTNFPTINIFFRLIWWNLVCG